MDTRDRIMGDQPNDFLHKIAGMVPGYHGYVDKEKRRDADKILRTQLAHKYSGQHARLTRIQQSLLRHGDLDNIAQVDHQAGVLQRFIDRLQNATYGYAGLFDPIKVQAPELDQLYAFDMALASGVDSLTGGIDSLESAATGEGTKAEMPAALDRLSSVINDLNERFDQRADLLTSGNTLPDSSYRALVGGMQGAGAPSSTAPAASPAISAQPGMTTTASMPTHPETPREMAGSGSSMGATGISSGAATERIGGASVAGPMSTLSGMESDADSMESNAGGGTGSSTGDTESYNPTSSTSDTATTSGGSLGAGTTNFSGSIGTGQAGSDPGGSWGSIDSQGTQAPQGTSAPTTAGIAGSGESSADAQSPTASGPIMSAADGMEQGGGLPVDDESIASGGSHTSSIVMTGVTPPDPAVDSMAQGNQGFGGTQATSDQGGSSPMALGGEAGTGTESASSPGVAPNAPGEGLVEGMGLSNTMAGLGGTQVTATGSSDIGTMNPGTGSTGASGTGLGGETQS